MAVNFLVFEWFLKYLCLINRHISDEWFYFSAEIPYEFHIISYDTVSYTVIVVMSVTHSYL